MVNGRNWRTIVIRSLLVSLGAGVVLAGSAYADPYADGVKYFGKKNYKAAVACFGMALKTNPYDYNSLYYSAIAFQYLGQVQQAKAAYGRLVDKFPYTEAGKQAQVALSRLDPKYLQSILKTNTAAASVSRQSSQSTSYPASGGVPSYFDSLPQQDRIYFSHDDGQGGQMSQPVVDASVNNRPIKMIFDTGASGTTFSKGNLRSLGIQPPAGKHVGESAGVGSEKGIKTWHAVINLKVGNIERKNFQIEVQEESTLHPLLGQDFFQDFRYTIDNGSKTIAFVRKSSPRGTHAPQTASAITNDRYAVPFRREGREMIVNVEVEGRAIPMYFDTGASSVCFTKKHINQLNIRIPDDAVDETHTGAAGATSAKRFPIGRIRCGPVEKREFDIVVLEAAQMNYPLLGQTFFGDWQYTIDNDNNVIKFVRR